MRCQCLWPSNGRIVILVDDIARIRLMQNVLQKNLHKLDLLRISMFSSTLLRFSSRPQVIKTIWSFLPSLEKIVGSFRTKYPLWQSSKILWNSTLFVRHWKFFQKLSCFKGWYIQPLLPDFINANEENLTTSQDPCSWMVCLKTTLIKFIVYVHQDAFT